ncbi:MAG: GEVED domain-containing protein, partial [Bacteroidota bacterium]
AGIPTAVSFELGTDTTYGYVLKAFPDTINGTATVSFYADLAGIAPATIYHFRVKAASSIGIIYGDDRTFATLVAPTGNFTFKPEKSFSITGVYMDLTNNGTAIPVDNYDNSNSQPVNIGFNFQYAGATFSQFVLNSNGFIKLGNVHPADSVQFFSSPQGYTGNMGGIFSSPHFADVFLLSPFNHDLQAGTNPPEFRIYTAGNPGSRISTIQFKNLQEKVEPPYRQFNNIEFQIRLYETNNVIEFIYGSWQPSGNPPLERAAAIGLKGTANTDYQLLTVSTWFPYEWGEVDFYASNYSPDWWAFNFGQAPNPNPNPGSMLVFSPKQIHDAAVNSIQTMGKLPIPYGLPHTPATYIQNTGYDTLTNIVVSMTISGNNSFSGTDTIPLLKPDSGMTVEFPGFNPSIEGYNTVNVTISNDDFMQDNTKSFAQKIGADTYYYCDSMPVWYALGFTWGGLPGSPGGLWLAKYHVNGIKNIRAATIGLGGGNGQNIYAVVLNSTGQVVAQSADYPLTEENSWQYHTFDFPNHPVIANSAFYIGIAQTESPDTYFPMGYQTESPNRRNAFYTAPLGGENLTESVCGVGRYSIEAVMDSGTCRPSFQHTCNESGYQQYINNFTTIGGFANISNLNTGCPSNSDGFIYYSGQTVAAEQGAPFNFNAEGVFSYHSNLAIWADWNQDGDFNDTLELVHSKTFFDNDPWSGTITIPTNANIGLTRMRVLFYYNDEAYFPPVPCRIYQSGETEEYDITVLPGTLMTYQSGLITQCDTLPPVLRGSFDNKIIRIKINSTGALSPLHLTAFNLESTGSADFTHDVSQVRIFWTGKDSVFSTANLFGAAANLSAAINGNQQLAFEKNYFWVTFDTRDTAALGHYIDASCLGYTIGSANFSTVEASPPGSQIIDYCIPGFRYLDGCATGYGITGFSTTGGITNISNLNNGCPANPYSYSRYTDQVATVRQGAQFAFNTSTTASRKLYIDWNQDTDFLESNEIVSTALSGIVTVPSDAVLGFTRLRVISFRQLPGPGGSTLRGCGGNSSRGETEDYTIHILPLLPETDSIENVTVGNGTDTCFNALQTIVVAGIGTNFVVEDGGSAMMVAGQKISFLEGSNVISGGYLHGYITTDSVFCGGMQASLATVKSGIAEFSFNSSESLFRVYPNPTTGDFTLEILDDIGYVKASVDIFNVRGEMVFKSDVSGQTAYELSLSGQPVGMYLVRIVVGGKSESARIIKQ